MEFDPMRPKWQQIADEITRRIERGDYPERFQLSEVRLAAEFGVNRDTMRKATKALRDSGLITTVPNMGTFVRAAEGQRDGE
ncbi:GntR family transcriptional regulator [Streptomyces uncialis]|uniref:GntR family transcriptional regulator n=1 Tax=Streptomyces uncialis TaxID=1048205 RepID=UPI00225449BD|nr:GntR family transcriptional regulator [Streptomyces uncialis]MCX4661113.1 GntR family transcriptional regulator [Streptomyces uncialis]WST69046.1 GntR family transcriptional regulator [Streptomyces uncialis]